MQPSEAKTHLHYLSKFKAHHQIILHQQQKEGAVKVEQVLAKSYTTSERLSITTASIEHHYSIYHPSLAVPLSAILLSVRLTRNQTLLLPDILYSYMCYTEHVGL